MSLKKPPKYLTNIVTYFDILGFKKLIEQQPATEISRILNIFKASAEGDRKEERDFMRTYVNFSDLSVRAVVVSSADYLLAYPALLDYELESIAGIQCKLIEDEGIVISGGMAIGPLSFDGEFVFGQGLVDAYEMDKRPTVPRIGVSSEIANIAERNAQERDHKIALNLIAKDQDTEEFYVDYLRAALIERSEDDAFNLLQRHADLVTMALEKFASGSSVRPKYEWMRRYHNEFVHTYFPIFDELLLD